MTTFLNVKVFVEDHIKYIRQTYIVNSTRKNFFIISSWYDIAEEEH